MMPFFSIIIPLYNKEKHIKDTLHSVLVQTFEDFEIIVVNDGSTDNSLVEVNTFNDTRIQVFTIENHGVSYARNFGIEKASYDFIAFLDADDIWYPGHLGDLKSLIDKFPSCGLYATAYTCQYNLLEIPSVYKNIPIVSKWMGIVDDYFESSTVNSIAWTSAVAIPKNILNKVGGFDERITYGAGEDIDLWIRIALKYPVAFCNEVSASYKLNAENRISNTNTLLRKFIDLDSYELFAKNSKSLKTYLDLNRFSIALQYKLAGNNAIANDYIKKISIANLNFKQRFLLQMNAPLLKGFLRIKLLLRDYGFYLSAFR